MQRLTYKVKHSRYGKDTYTFDPLNRKKAAERLAEYENTGLEPSEVKRLAEIASEQCYGRRNSSNNQ